MMRRRWIALARANKDLTLGRELTANPNLAEAQDHTAAGGGPAKAHLWAESREKQHLIQLALHVYVYLAGNHAIAHCLAVRIDRGLDEQWVLSVGARHLLELRHLKSSHDFEPRRLQ